MVRSSGFRLGGVHFSNGLVEGAGLLGDCRVGEREDICDDIVLASLVFDLEVIFREAKNPAFDPGGRGQILPKEIAKCCVVGPQEKFLAKQKHSEVLDGAHHCLELDFIRSIVAL